MKTGNIWARHENDANQDNAKSFSYEQQSYVIYGTNLSFHFLRLGYRIWKANIKGTYTKMEGLERGSENQSPKQLQESDGFQVHVRLPTGETASFQAKRSSSVRDLKMIVEVNSGVPSDLFTLVNTQGDNNTIALEDDTNMAHMTTRANVDGSMTFELSIPPWWQRFVDRCMKRDNRQIIKRIAIKMNQISSEERAFVAAFIAAQKGDGQLFRSLMNGDVKIDVLQTVQCSGRTLLHAAVAGGNFSCAAAIFMNDGSSLLTKADHHGVTPVDMATNSNQPGLVQLLAKYVELKAWESLQDEADVGKSSEEKGLQDSSANGENYQGGEGELVEGSEKDEEVSQNESKDNSAVVHDSDNRARPDQTREVGQTKENKDEMREGSSTARVPPQGMLNRGPNPQPKQHTPLRASKSLNTQNRPGSAKSKLVCVEEIRPLSCKAVPAVKQPEEKLPRVNTPPASPMNSPRMGRKLLPSLLTTDRPGSPILRPRSPALPCPRSPSSPRPKSPFMESPSGSPAFRRKVFRLASSPEPQRKRGISLHGGENEPQRARAMTYQAGDNGEARYVENGRRGWVSAELAYSPHIGGVTD